jgi:hypothetical protein
MPPATECLHQAAAWAATARARRGAQIGKLLPVNYGNPELRPVVTYGQCVMRAAGVGLRDGLRPSSHRRDCLPGPLGPTDGTLHVRIPHYAPCQLPLHADPSVSEVSSQCTV